MRKAKTSQPKKKRTETKPDKPKNKNKTKLQGATPVQSLHSGDGERQVQTSQLKTVCGQHTTAP